MKIEKPLPGEYAEFYAGYINRVINDDVLRVLRDQPRELRALLGDVTDHAAQIRPDEDEWSINEVIGHLNDGERIFAYRALRIARGDATPLASFDQDAYILPGKFNTRSLASLLDEFESARNASLTLVNSLDAEMLAHVGTASNNPISARALVFIMAGHVHHHIESLKSVYLQK
jgi:enhancing lycopene biosynthesis protein 2